MSSHGAKKASKSIHPVKGCAAKSTVKGNKLDNQAKIAKPATAIQSFSS